MSRDWFQVSSVTFDLDFDFLDKEVELVGGKSFINKPTPSSFSVIMKKKKKESPIQEKQSF